MGRIEDRVSEPLTTRIRDSGLGRGKGQFYLRQRLAVLGPSHQWLDTQGQMAVKLQLPR